MTGDHNLNATDGYEQNVPIEKIFRHPQYTSNLRRGTTDYDVALVKLQSPLNYNNRVWPVCLPLDNFPANTICYVTGWGATSKGGSSPQVIKIYRIRNLDETHLRWFTPVTLPQFCTLGTAQTVKSAHIIQYKVTLCKIPLTKIAALINP